MRKAVSTFALVFILVAASACRDEPQTEEVNPIAAPVVQHSTDSATHPASPGGSAVVPDIDAGTTVLAVITEGSIAVREQSIPPGPAVITVQNAGTDVHNLFIEGDQISRAAGDPIPAGQMSTVDVLFRPGTYTFYCPVLNHRELGEQIEVTIGTAAGTTPAATTGS